MESSVELHDPFSYALWPIIVCFAVAAVVVIFFAALAVARKRKDRRTENLTVIERTPEDREQIRNRYLDMLSGIRQSYDMGELDVRGAYQQMSGCIRDFVYEMTGIKVQNCTLQDIRHLNMPPLQEIVAEYYSPEFSERSEGDVFRTVDVTRSIVERWP